MSDEPTTVQPAVRAVEPVRLSAYPRARRSIRRVRAWTGLLVLAVVAALSLRAGLPAFDAVARGLGAGIAAHFLAWAAAVAVWRQLTLAELELAREAHEARLAERRAQRDARRAAQA
jgi:hypothetical protein